MRPKIIRYLRNYKTNYNSRKNINVVNYISILQHILTYNENYNQEYNNANEVLTSVLGNVK